MHTLSVLYVRMLLSVAEQYLQHSVPGGWMGRREGWEEEEGGGRRGGEEEKG